MNGARITKYIGGYRVIATIGVGSSATVYRCLDEATGRQVAIKVLADNHSVAPERRRRFLDEMELLAAIESPSVATIYEVGETKSGQSFMVLELADRGDLRHRVEDVNMAGGILGRSDLVVLAQHLAESLSVLHKAGIVHRDVSPGNVLIRIGAEGAPPPAVSILETGERFLLADLGLAKDLDYASGITAGGGTRGFAAPEQRERVTVVDHRADVFSATAVLEWAASGTGLVERLDPFLDIGLAVDPNDRFNSMEEWLAALRWSLGFPTRAPAAEKTGSRSAAAVAWSTMTSTVRSRIDGIGIGWGPSAAITGVIALVVISGIAIVATVGTRSSESVDASAEVTTSVQGPSDTGSSDTGSSRRGSSGASSESSPGVTEPGSATVSSPALRSQSDAGPTSVAASVASTTAEESTSTLTPSSSASTVTPTTAPPASSSSTAPTSSAAPSTTAPSTTAPSTTGINPLDVASPRAFLSSPADGATIAGDLAIDGVAGRSAGIASVELVIKNVDTDRYWHDASNSFESTWIRFPVSVSPAGGSDVTWSYQVHEDALPPGRYLLRVWARAASGAGDPISDLRYITITG